MKKLKHRVWKMKKKEREERREEGKVTYHPCQRC